MKDWIGMGSALLWIVWVSGSWCIDFRHWLPERMVSIGRRVFFEMRPFAPVLVVGQHINLMGLGGWGWFFDGLNIACWLILRTKKDDEDRWKKRGKKLAEKVQRQGARLVVVPAGGRS